MRLGLLIVAATLGFGLAAVPAHAGIYLEPYLKYEASGGLTSTMNAANGGATATADQTGLGFGGRVGYKFVLISATLDYSMTNGQLKGTTTSDMSETQLFAVLGVHMPLVRAYAGYGLMNELTAKGTGGDVTFKGGSAVKLGAGFTGLPFITIGLEYVLSSYDKIKTSAGEVDKNAAGFSDLTGKSLSLIVSAPFDF